MFVTVAIGVCVAGYALELLEKKVADYLSFGLLFIGGLLALAPVFLDLPLWQKPIPLVVWVGALYLSA
ncbi:MAG: hypothetical protein EBX51_03325 [Acidimicrobiia bacterium]|nr:hypothetical protein [Acidimicrobiia bacterium]